MAINTLGTYVDIVADAVENFHGNQLVYIDWDRHRMFSAAAAFPLPPEMPFGALLQEVIPGIWSGHPDYENLQWDSVEWILDDQPFVPNPDASLAENGIGHKSLLRFITPGLDGVDGSGN
jgi:phenol hydroxylase P4 protein